MSSRKSRSAVFVMGPTASGKSALALALAEHLDADGQPVEIVSVDSAQVYRGMDVGTAKPDAAERARVPHHLIDICDPEEAYSAARFATDARQAIDAIHGRGRLPLLVGGTMLYFRALARGLSDLPAADPVLRAEFLERGRQQGWPALHAELARLDPESAARLHPNDGQRIQRALEVHRLSGVPLSQLQGRARGEGGNFLRIALLPESRPWLHARIEQRLSRMFADGLVEEVACLRRREGLHPELPSMRSVGYRQVWAHLEGACDLPTAQARALAATRQLAKRQITWLRSEHDICRIDPATEFESADGLNSGARGQVHHAVGLVRQWLRGRVLD